MKTLYYLIIFTNILIICSCNKNEKLFLKENEKLEGEWVYTKATSNKNLRCTDVLDDYRDYKISFDLEKNMVLENRSTGEKWQGIYKIETFNEPFLDEVRTNTNFTATLRDTSNNIQEIFWEDINFTRNKIRYNENYSDRTNTFVLANID